MADSVRLRLENKTELLLVLKAYFPDSTIVTEPVDCADNDGNFDGYRIPCDYANLEAFFADEENDEGRTIVIRVTFLTARKLEGLSIWKAIKERRV